MNNNRVRVTNPSSSLTSRCTVFLSISAEDGTHTGSGFLIRSNVVVTAGHAVYNQTYGENDWGWAKSITITPAANATGTTAPYGTAKAIRFICGGDWAKSGNNDDDWGIIILDTNIGDSTGWFGLHCQSASYNGTSVRANGYDKYRFQYTVSGTISTSKSKTLASIDMYVDNGMSGGPCYIYKEEYGYMAVGIIINYLSYDPEGYYHYESTFRRIDETLYNKLLQYCEQYSV